MPLVEVRAAGQDRDLPTGDLTDHEAASVPDHVRRWPVRNGGVLEDDGVLKSVGEGAKTRPEHDGNVRCLAEVRPHEVGGFVEPDRNTSSRGWYVGPSFSLGETALPADARADQPPLKLRRADDYNDRSRRQKQRRHRGVDQGRQEAGKQTRAHRARPGRRASSAPCRRCRRAECQSTRSWQSPSARRWPGRRSAATAHHDTPTSASRTRRTRSAPAWCRARSASGATSARCTPISTAAGEKITENRRASVSFGVRLGTRPSR